MAFNLREFFGESVRTVLASKKYFSGMPVTGGFAEPLVKAALYGLASGVVMFVFAILKVNTSLVSVPGMVPAGGFGAALAVLVFSPVAAVIGVFVGGLVLLILSSLCGGSTKFQANARATAALMALAPVSTVLSAVTAVNPAAGMIVSLAVSLYGMVMLYFALTEALKARPASSRVLAVILAVLLTVFTIGGYFGMKQGTRYLQNAIDELERKDRPSAEDMKEMMRKLSNTILENLKQDGR